MRVGIDWGPLLDPITGVGRYTRELAGALEARGLELVRYAVSWGGAAGNDVKRWRVPARAAQLAWRRFDRPSVTRLTGPVDLVHATNFVLPATGGVPGVVTVHDLSFYRDDAFPGSHRLRDLVPWSVQRARKVLVPTDAIAAEVSDAFGLDREAIATTYEGVAGSFFGGVPLSDPSLAALGITRPYVLAAATLEPRKNLARLMEAWKAAAPSLGGWTLAIAGAEGWGPKLEPVDGVRLLGWVGDETLPGLMAGAELFCYPSLYEGFGLPPLEAMASGTPCLVGRYSAAPEVLGEAARLVDPTSVDAIAQGLIDLATDDAGRSALVLLGRARAAEFTWERAAERTIRAYSGDLPGPTER
jgi:glycosyltransferase involved in cell wall biosynthesis